MTIARWPDSPKRAASRRDAELAGDLHSDRPRDGRLGERDRQTALTAVVGRVEEVSFCGCDEAIDEPALGVEVDLDGAGAEVVAHGEVFARAE